ncbi:MAG: DUF2520 domain-containing protein [Bacteroidota bacterium]
MLSVVILGTGNVAENLFHAFYESTSIRLTQVVGRNEESLKKFQDKTKVSSDFENLVQADIYVIAISDNAIPEISKKITQEGLVVHTSGATPMEVIPTKNRGVFYPLQTFTKGHVLDFSTIPICVEAEDPMSFTKLQQLGECISNKVYGINSEQRKKLHLSAVFANNFSNHLFHISEVLCKEENLSFELLKPLILETVKKLDFLSPLEAQTGPARRKDSESMKRHLELLTDEKQIKLYMLLSEAISKTYEKEL